MKKGHKYKSYLKTIKPFHILPEEVLFQVAGMMDECIYKEETVVYRQDESLFKGIDIIVEGQYDAYFSDSAGTRRLEEHYAPGLVYGAGSALLNKKVSIRTVVARKGTIALFLDKEEFKALCRSYEQFFLHFSQSFGEKVLNDDYAHFVRRHHTRDENFLDADKIYSRRLNAFEPRTVYTCTPHASLHEAAALMREKKCSCLFVRDESGYKGLITHRVMVEQGLANGFGADLAVGQIMNPTVVVLPDTTLAYEAILKMFQAKTDYFLVRSESGMGMLSRHLLLSEHAQSPLVFIQSVRMARSVTELKQKWELVPEAVTQLIGRGVNASVVNQIVTTISDTILHRVIESTLEELPSPPSKFAFMVLGSEGRCEQTLLTDQDNALIYEDKANENREAVREYFLNFASIISDKLNSIGFSYCQGGYMAKNPKWSHSLSHWKRNYEEWINNSTPESVMNVTTFFDCRFIHGEPLLFDELGNYVAELLKSTTSRFYYNMAKNALQYEPMLTMFNAFRTISRQEGKVLDIKKAMTPIVDMARMYALQHQIDASNTGERLKALHEKGVFTLTNFKEVYQAYYYMMGLRLKTQAQSIIHDYLEPTNYIEPAKLTQVEQTTLKEIFKVIKNFQYRIKLQFNVTI